MVGAGCSISHVSLAPSVVGPGLVLVLVLFLVLLPLVCLPDVAPCALLIPIPLSTVFVEAKMYERAPGTYSAGVVQAKVSVTAARDRVRDGGRAGEKGGGRL